MRNLNKKNSSIANIILNQIKLGHSEDGKIGSQCILDWNLLEPVALPSGLNAEDDHVLGGLTFKVSGKLHSGCVNIELIADDSYTVRLFDINNVNIKVLTMIFFSNLTEVLDSNIDNY